MYSGTNRADVLKNPYVHVLAPVVAAAALNGFIYSSRQTLFQGQTLFQVQNPVQGLPPGYVIGAVWLVLFAFMGYAHYLLYSSKGRLTAGCVAIELLFVYSMLYPFLTGLRPKAGLVFNLLALVGGFLTAGFVLRESDAALAFVAPYLLWAFYVNLVFVLLCSRS